MYTAYRATILIGKGDVTKNVSNLHGCDTKIRMYSVHKAGVNTTIHVMVYTVYPVQCTVFFILPSTTRGWKSPGEFHEKMENGKCKMPVENLPRTTEFICLDEELQFVSSGTDHCTAVL